MNRCHQAAASFATASGHFLCRLCAWVAGIAGMGFAAAGPAAEPAADPGRAATPCAVLVDARTEAPLRTILAEYQRQSGSAATVRSLPASDREALVEGRQLGCDVLVLLEEADTGADIQKRFPTARKVAWKYPSGEPVWAAPVTGHPDAARIVSFLGGPTGHRLWSESEAGFTIVPDQSAESYLWVVRNRTARTYPMTAMRMLGECGGIRRALCIDVGCGTGHLDVELAKRSDWTIVGLDIDPEMKPLFERTVREAGLEDRISFVLGDAQKMPFPDDYADVIVSRGTLIFIPDIAKCLREVERVLKPTGVGFLGGRYLYAPRVHRISTGRLRAIVRQSGVAGARVIDDRGQWVKIVGPEAPEAARTFRGSPEMRAGRLVVDYGITRGTCLLIQGSDGALQQALERGMLRMTDLEITALYPREELAQQARSRIAAAGHADRVRCRWGDIHQLPFPDASFDLAAGVGPVLIWADRPRAMRELHRVLRPGGVAFVGGRYLGMPPSRRVSSDALRQSAQEAGIRSIRVIDEMGQWVEIRKTATSGEPSGP